MNEQHREDTGLSKIAPNGVWPSNHAAIVKPQFAVVEATTDTDHGAHVQAAACLGYAPGGCTAITGEHGVPVGVEGTLPFTYIAPREGDHLGGAFQNSRMRVRLREHPNLKIASLSVYYAPQLTDVFVEEGVVTVNGAGNEPVVNWREDPYNMWLWDREEHAENPAWDGVLAGDRLLQRLRDNQVLLVAGYKKDANGRFVPHDLSTQCGGVDGGCLYAPYDFDYRSGRVILGGTSSSAPFVAAGLASVLAVFPETSGEDLIRLAKACAVSEPGLPNGLGRFSLSCMDNSEVFYLNRDGTEETVEGMSARAQGMALSFASAPLPGDSTYVAEVEGVSLVRDMEGIFSHQGGIMTVPSYRGVDEDDNEMRVSLFYDYNNRAPGIRAGNRDVFLAASWTNEATFFGYGQYQTESLNVSAGTENLYLRFSNQQGDRVGYGVINNVEGTSIGATLTHTFTTPAGDLTPFLNMDKFTGGEAGTPFGSMQIHGSEWNQELGLRARRQVSEHGNLQVIATASHRGDIDREDYGVRVRYGVRF